MSDGMHGRKKEAAEVNEAAIQARKVKELQKVERYKDLCTQFWAKRKDQIMDADALSLTTQILSLHPDFYTVWNFRREILLHSFAHMNEDEKQTACVAEMSFCDQTLKLNPKSYWVFNHRRWTLGVMPNPTWERELKLLEMMLNLDARNFHGWDYRRYVIATSSSRTPTQEFAFTTTKINQNFSNYSAWHYRSKLLSKIRDNPEGTHRKGGERWKETAEFDLIRNAIYTEPADQSAWLYQRWLFGDAPSPINVVAANYTRTSNTQIVALILFNQPVSLTDSAELQINGIKSTSEAQPLHPKQPFSSLWRFTLDQSSTSLVSISVRIWAGTLETRQKDENEADISVEITGNENVSLTFSADVPAPEEYPGESGRAVFHRELEAIQELYEVEPNSKWVMLTINHLLTRLNEGLDQCTNLLARLVEVDPLRKGYYEDLLSDLKWQLASSSEKGKLTLTNASLTKLPNPSTVKASVSHLSELSSIDASMNRISSIREVFVFLSVERLVLDDNEIDSTDGFGVLSRLRELSLRRNRIRVESGLHGLRECGKLTQLWIDGNPLQIDAVVLKTLLPLLQSINDVVV
ncbi:hypothetical protein BJ742DRAFT_396309 [Cladochytrium replicatum]|nr:hypothetical protein BJ742DRAFT_396309 [Cladochytrium replicatum]